jgi:hypothetical protein
MTTRIRECDEGISAGRLRKALQFRDAAKTIREFADDEAEVGDAFVTLCIQTHSAARRWATTPKATITIRQSRSFHG